MVYLNKTVAFSVDAANIGIPKTNSQMQEVHLLNIQSSAFEELKKAGIYCAYPGYRHHITIGEVSRQPHPALNKSILMREILGSESEISREVNTIVFSSSPQNIKSQTATEMFGFGTKLPSGKIRLWSFNTPDTSSQKHDEIRSNSVYRP